jgi:hypothetical protein
MDVSGQLHAWLLYHRYPVDKRLGGHQNQPGHGGEEKNSQPLLGLEPPIIQPIAQHYTTELSTVTNAKKTNNTYLGP